VPSEVWDFHYIQQGGLCARFIIHGWGIIFKFFPFVLVKYLYGASILWFLQSPRLKSLNFNVAILSCCARTACIPFGRYAVTMVYSKYLGTLSQLTTPARGRMYSGKMVEISFAFARSSLCFVLFSVTTQDGLDPRAIDEEACTPLVDEPCTPTDITLSYMTLSVMRSMSTSFTDSSTALSSSDIHACG
jgi:hypothetical protein